jgi:hypothetical protein
VFDQQEATGQAKLNSIADALKGTVIQRLLGIGAAKIR